MHYTSNETAWKKNIWKQISQVTSLGYSAFEPTEQLPRSSSCGLLKSRLHLCSGRSRELLTARTAPEQRAADVTVCHASVRRLKQMRVSAPDKPTRSALIKENFPPLCLDELDRGDFSGKPLLLLRTPLGAQL